MPFDMNKYQNAYQKANYDIIKFVVPKGKKQEIKEYADAHEMSMSQLISKALWEKYRL